MTGVNPRMDIHRARRVLDALKNGGNVSPLAVYAALVVTGDIPRARGADLTPPVHIRMPVGTWEGRKP